MQYIEVRIETSTGGIDAVCARLIALGVEGIQIEDEADFQDFLQNSQKYWDYVDEELLQAKRGICCVKVYLEDNEQGKTMLKDIRVGMEALKADRKDLELGSLAVLTGGRDAAEWENAWQQYYKPMEIGQRLYIRPEWEKQTCPPGRTQLISNPGMAFGTGTHASTHMCLEALDREIRGGETVLDLGCGSGILGIAALLLGAKSCLAVDIDQGAAGVAQENAAKNGVDGGFCALWGDVLTDASVKDKIGEKKYDLVTANIVADVIIALAGAAAPLLAPNGRFLVSGIIDTRAQEVKAALDKAGFTLREEYTEGGWHAMLLGLS